MRRDLLPRLILAVALGLLGVAAARAAPVSPSGLAPASSAAGTDIVFCDQPVQTSPTVVFATRGCTADQLAALARATSLQTASNLGDLLNPAAARTNLGVTATGADTSYIYRSNNFSDVASLPAALSNLGTEFTVAAFKLAQIPAVVTGVRTLGYYAPGDGGDALYAHDQGATFTAAQSGTTLTIGTAPTGLALWPGQQVTTNSGTTETILACLGTAGCQGATALTVSGTLTFTSQTITAWQGCDVQSADGQRWALSGSDISARVCGAKIDGATDDVPALTQAAAYLAGMGGGLLEIPAGTVAIASADCVGGLSPLVLPNNIAIEGRGKTVSSLKVTGVGQCSELLPFQNPNNDFVRHLSLVSNQASLTSGIPGLLLFEETAGATGPSYHNFGADDVLLGETSDNYKASVIDLGAYPMVNASFTHMKCIFASGDDQTPTNVAVPSDCFEAYGEYNSANGTIENFTVSDGYGDGTWGKRFCTIWSGVVGAHCDRNYIYNFGAETALIPTPSPGPFNTNTGAYALLSYDISADVSGAGQPSRDVWFVDNVVINPYSDGIYCEDTINCASRGNHISGQTDTGDATIPKAGISYNGSTGEIDHNILTNNFRDIVTIPQGSLSASGGLILVDHNTGTGSVANAQGIVVRGNGTGGYATNVTVLDNNSDLQTGTASVGTYWWSGGSASQIGNIIATGGHYQGTNIDLRTFDTTTNHGILATSLYIGGGMLLDGAPTIDTIDLQQTATPTVIDGVIMDFTTVPTGSSGGYFLSETALTINNLTIRNATVSGQKPITLSGARGSMLIGALQFQNVTVSPRFVSTDFGFSTPPWGADSGVVIAAINPTLGVQGWQNNGGGSGVASWPVLGTSATSQATVASPTAPASTSVYAMQGLAGAITPIKTGTVKITVSGTITNASGTAGNGLAYQISYGTGTAPTNAASLTGTQAGSVQTYVNASTVTAADVMVPFSQTVTVTGLTVGTAYWIDLAAKSVGAVSTGALSAVSISANEQ